MKNHRRWLAGLLCMTMVAGTLLTGCGDISYITGVLPSDQASEMSTVDTQATTLLDTTIPEFITGRTELNEETWAEFQQELKDIGVDKITQYIKDAQ